MNEAQGLSSAEAEVRLQVNGPNEVVPSHLESRLSELKRLLLDPMGIMLLGLGSIYAVLGHKTDAIILFLAYIPVTAVDVLLELKAHKALQALKKTLKVTAKVLRDGSVQTIPTRTIVTGDVIVFEEGQAIPADGIILEVHQLQVNEAAVTGESLPIDKEVSSEFFGGTVVLQGRGLGLVKSIGKATRFGKIASLLQETKSVKSPLQIKVNRIVNRMLLMAIVLAIVLFILEYARSRGFLASLVVALTFGMAAVPEEFPIVFTLYLSLGAWRLTKTGVLVKSLPSVETLGSVDVICTDKTGTLTEGRFQLEELRSVHSKLSQEELWLYALMACEEKPIDAMETAIYKKAEASVPHLKEWHLKWDNAFDPVGKNMSHVWVRSSDPSQMILAMKGAVEGVVDHCTLSTDERTELLSWVDALAGKGKRLLGLAIRKGSFDGNRSSDELGLEFAGILIFSDPVRTSAKGAIEACQTAGITIKMLTGDHPLTAHAVADETGITHRHDQIFTGNQLAKMSKETRWSAYLKGVIFSRVLPEQKHEMVQALQANGKVVAMTGDGINDAPALKLANIGISMGADATDVARSSAQIVLLKSDFDGIVKAVFEGRRIFSNLRRSFSYLISFHVPVVLLALVPPALGWGDLLLPIHIVLLELIVHPVSAFAFEALPVSDSHASRKLVSVRRLLEALLSGLLLSIGCLFLYRYFWMYSNQETARAVSLAGILMGNVAFVFVDSWPFQTRRFFITLGTLVSLTAGMLWVPFIAEVFHFGSISLPQVIFAICIGMLASVPCFLLRRRGRLHT